MIDQWSAEAALVARPFLKVEVHRLLPGGYAFIRALSEAQTVAMAVRAATATTSEFEFPSNLAANVIVGIHPPDELNSSINKGKSHHDVY